MEHYTSDVYIIIAILYVVTFILFFSKRKEANITNIDYNMSEEIKILNVLKGIFKFPFSKVWAIKT